MGESDTLIVPNGSGEWWSYAHASDRSAGVKDSCGAPVEFPGCVVVYKSRDEGQTFAPDAPICQMTCDTCPCDAARDHPQQQQYPRVHVTHDTWHMVYEFGGKTMLRTSADGLNWGEAEWVFNTGVWTREIRPCKLWEGVRPHPFTKADYECLAGGPPGLFVESGTLYVFVAMGQNPGAMGCLFAPTRQKPVVGFGMEFKPCRNNPLFIGNWDYGNLQDVGPGSNAHFDHRTISSAEILKIGNRFYMLYEGVRGPGPIDVGDNQFGLGLARSTTARIDGPWEKMSRPILMDLPGNIGLGHADIVVTPQGDTVLFTSLDGVTRSRLRLVWK
jgi:hypothetical protein